MKVQRNTMRIIKSLPRSTGSPPSRISKRCSGRSFVKAFKKNDQGSVSIEMGFATIVFTTLLAGMVSFGSLFFVQGSMADAARDTVRRMATGEMTPVEAQTYAQSNLITWGASVLYTVTATNDGTDATVDISVPMADAALIDFLGIFSGDLRASVTMPVES